MKAFSLELVKKQFFLIIIFLCRVYSGCNRELAA